MRMIFFKLVVVLALCCTFFGCGEISDEQGSSKGAEEVIKLLKSERLPDHRWRYTLGLNSLVIMGFRDQPFIMGQFNGWKVEAISDSDKDGWYEVEISTFNQETRFTYGGSHTTNSFADITRSHFYNAKDQALVIGFKDGAIFQKGVASFPLPAEAAAAKGDDVRISLSGSTLSIYFNNQKINGSTKRPFHFGSYNGWTAEGQTVIDSSGWGKTVIWSGALPRSIEFMYGGDNTPFSQQDWSWAIATDSLFFDPVSKTFKASISAAGVVSPGFEQMELVKLISSRQLAGGLWEYTLGLRLDAVSGSKSQPFVMKDFENWQVKPISDSNSDGWLETVITTATREVRFTYGGNYAMGSYADITKSRYFSATDNALVIGLKDGAIYKKGVI